MSKRQNMSIVNTVKNKFYSFATQI